jgi:hypothetical protein
MHMDARAHHMTAQKQALALVLALSLPVAFLSLSLSFFNALPPFPFVFWTTCAARCGMRPHDTQQETSTRASLFADRDPASQPAQLPGPHAAPRIALQPTT